MNKIGCDNKIHVSGTPQNKYKAMNVESAKIRVITMAIYACKLRNTKRGSYFNVRNVNLETNPERCTIIFPYKPFFSQYIFSFCFLPHQSQLKLGKPYFPMETTTPQNRPQLFLSSYTTKHNQIQYATLFQPN